MHWWVSAFMLLTPAEPICNFKVHASRWENRLCDVYLGKTSRTRFSGHQSDYRGSMEMVHREKLLQPYNGLQKNNIWAIQ